MPFDFATVTVPFRMQPGLRRAVPGGDLLAPSEIGSAHLAAKCEVLSDHAHEALVAVPGFDDWPVFEAVAAASSAVRLEGPRKLFAPRLGWSIEDGEVTGDGPGEIGACLRALPVARRAAGLLALAVAEDLAVVDGASTRIPWLAVCLPSHWSPAEKIGLPLAAVHAPVADSATLVAASEALARLVTGGECWERFVWTVTPRSALDAHPRRKCDVGWPAPPTPAAVAAAAFFRTEHQTFLPLPTSPRQALFAIRIEVTPLAEAVATPANARRLREALSSMSDAVLAYRGLAPVRDPLVAWLGERAG